MNTLKPSIAFFLENHLIPAIDFSHPFNGNPGCGGTEYLFSALPSYLKLYLKNAYNFTILANSCVNLPGDIPNKEVHTLLDALHVSASSNCDFFVFRPRRKLDQEFLAELSFLNQDCIAWLHITPEPSYLRALSLHANIRAIVCVEHEQYEQIKDIPNSHKLTYIVNGFDSAHIQNCVYHDNIFRYMSCPLSVVYVGAINIQKGFHVLARVWPKIITHVPNARLSVIGSGSLYGTDITLGPLGVADLDYESRYILPYLVSPDGSLLDSVEFLGRLDQAKYDYMSRAAVGVVNPTGQTENCPASALEFASLGVPVVSGAFYGMMDTVLHGHTGLLGFNDRHLISNIVYLLKQRKVAFRFGCNGREFVKDRYSYSKVAGEWDKLFSALLQSQSLLAKPQKDNVFRHYKYIVFLNSILQNIFGRLVSWPTFYGLKILLSKFLCQFRL